VVLLAPIQFAATITLSFPQSFESVSHDDGWSLTKQFKLGRLHLQLHQYTSMSSDDDKPMVVPPKPKKLKKKVSKKVTSKAPRYSKFLDMAAKEKGHTDSEDVHSEDDRDEPDLSFVVSDDNDTHADDNMLAVYQESLCSQAAALGFGTPISKRRSKERGDQPGAIVCRILEKNERRSKRKLARKVANHDPQSGSPSRPIPGSTIPRSPAALLNCSHHPVLLNSPSALSCLRPPLVVHPTSSSPSHPILTATIPRSPSTLLNGLHHPLSPSARNGLRPPHVLRSPSTLLNGLHHPLSPSARNGLRPPHVLRSPSTLLHGLCPPSTLLNGLHPTLMTLLAEPPSHEQLFKANVVAINPSRNPHRMKLKPKLVHKQVDSTPSASSCSHGDHLCHHLRTNTHVPHIDSPSRFQPGNHVDTSPQMSPSSLHGAALVNPAHHTVKSQLRPTKQSQPSLIQDCNGAVVLIINISSDSDDAANSTVLDVPKALTATDDAAISVAPDELKVVTTPDDAVLTVSHDVPKAVTSPETASTAVAPEVPKAVTAPDDAATNVASDADAPQAITDPLPTSPLPLDFVADSPVSRWEVARRQLVMTEGMCNSATQTSRNSQALRLQDVIEEIQLLKTEMQHLKMELKALVLALGF
jgi:hypothetical protein